MTLVDPATAYIGPDVAIGSDTVVQPGVFLEGRTVIGPECEIHAGARIVDSTLGAAGHGLQSHGDHAEPKIGDDAHVGPFARIRPCYNTWSWITRRKLRRDQEIHSR